MQSDKSMNRNANDQNCKVGLQLGFFCVCGHTDLLNINGFLKFQSASDKL